MKILLIWQRLRGALAYAPDMELYLIADATPADEALLRGANMAIVNSCTETPAARAVRDAIADKPGHAGPWAACRVYPMDTPIAGPVDLVVLAGIFELEGV